jgi:hypothetical protein
MVCCLFLPLILCCAGNSGISLRQEVPAACPGTLVVTAISDNDGTVGAADKPPSWSNYLPMPDADNISARMLAAPGAWVPAAAVAAASAAAAAAAGRCSHVPMSLLLPSNC